VARFTAGPLQVTPELARADFEACAAFDVRTRLPGVTAPTLILAGSEDQLVGAGRTRQLAAGIAGSRLEVVADAGHMVMQEQPARVNAALTEFLAGSSRTE
jgi:3-oxoadipate enol-lactonase/4-carboxymuconolactone decarboxylase